MAIRSRCFGSISTNKGPNFESAAENSVRNIDDDYGEILFLDAPAGTGKTFLISLMLALIHAQSQSVGRNIIWDRCHIVKRRTNGSFCAQTANEFANSRWTDVQHCQIPAMAKVLQNSKIIIWDEYRMTHKRALIGNGKRPIWRSFLFIIWVIVRPKWTEFPSARLTSVRQNAFDRY